MLMGILAGWHEAGDKKRNTWTCGGTWIRDGEQVVGYAVIVDGRVTEVVDRADPDAITKAVGAVKAVARTYAEPVEVGRVAMPNVGQYAVIESIERGCKP